MVLRGAGWHAARWGLGDHLVDPRDGVPRTSGQVIEPLLHYVESALRGNGDSDLVAAGLDRVLLRGNGASRQRAVYRRHSALHAIVQDAAEITQAPPD